MRIDSASSKPTTPLSSWTHDGPTFDAKVTVQPRVNEWLKDQEPGASLYRWGLLLGSMTPEEVVVEEVLPIQTRHQLLEQKDAPHFHQVVGMCGWGAGAAAQRESTKLFGELFPQAGSVLLFATSHSPGAAPRVQVFAQDGRPEPVRRRIQPSSVVTWVITVATVALAAWLLSQWLR